MSSQMFKAQVTLGSWIGSPIFPSVDLFIAIIEDRMRWDRKHKDQVLEDNVKPENEDEYIVID